MRRGDALLGQRLRSLGAVGSRPAVRLAGARPEGTVRLSRPHRGTAARVAQKEEHPLAHLPGRRVRQSDRSCREWPADGAIAGRSHLGAKLQAMSAVEISDDADHEATPVRQRPRRRPPLRLHRTTGRGFPTISLSPACVLSSSATATSSLGGSGRPLRSIASWRMAASSRSSAAPAAGSRRSCLRGFRACSPMRPPTQAGRPGRSLTCGPAAPRSRVSPALVETVDEGQPGRDGATA